MNLFLISIVTALLFQSILKSCIGSSTYNIFPRLPFGQYKLIFKHIKSCDLPQDNKIQFNFYLSKNPKSNATELRGTIINTVPLDDNFFLEASFALRDADGSWKDNTYIIKKPKACSSLRLLLGAEWTNIMNNFGVKNATCPILPGIYVSSGMDTSIISNINIPKTFIYGTYKIRIFFTRLNEVYGCIIYVLEFKRP